MVKVRLSSPNFDAEEEAYDDPGVEGVHKQFAKRLGRCSAFMQIAWERHGTLLGKKTNKLWNSKTLHKGSRLLYLSHLHAHACMFNNYLMVSRCFLCTNTSGRDPKANNCKLYFHLIASSKCSSRGKLSEMFPQSKAHWQPTTMHFMMLQTDKSPILDNCYLCLSMMFWVWKWPSKWIKPK